LVNKVEVHIQQVTTASLPSFVVNENDVGAIAYYSHEFNDDVKALGEQNVYSELNRILNARGEVHDPAALQRWSGFMHYLINGIQKCPRFQQTVYRGIKGLVAHLTYDTQYIQDHYVIWVAITSTSVVKAEAEIFLKGAGTLFTILPGHNGRDISQLSFYPDEREILFLPNTIFKIVSVKYDAALRRDLIVLEEVSSLFEISKILEVKKKEERVIVI